MARWEIVAIIVVLMIALSVTVPMVLRLRSAGRLSRCQANLRIIGSGLKMHALQRGDVGWVLVPEVADPIRYVGLMDYENVRQGPENRSVSVDEYTRRVGAPPQELTTSRYIWGVLREEASSQWNPRSQKRSADVEDFICPASADVAAKGAMIGGKWYPAAVLHDFGSWRSCSYGIQVPFQPASAPRLDAPDSMIMLADKGPWSRMPELHRKSVAAPDVQLDADPVWTLYNSPNHSGTGQNVYFADGSVDFRADPLAGAGRDNIYTAWQAGTGESPWDTRTGCPPTLKLPHLPPAGSTDTLIYP